MATITLEGQSPNRISAMVLMVSILSLKPLVVLLSVHPGAFAHQLLYGTFGDL
jgi:hypothetical protein